ncbi:hypothetical protein CR513_17164, partial [Mucuna pruriens]
MRQNPLVNMTLEIANNKVELLKNFLVNIRLEIKPTSSMSMYSDCQLGIVIAKNKTYNQKNRHIQLRHNVIKKLSNSSGKNHEENDIGNIKEKPRENI